MIKELNLEIGKEYYHTDGVKTFEVLKEHGERVILLPKIIANGKECSPIVLGEQDMNFFRKLVDMDTETLEKRIHDNAVQQTRTELSEAIRLKDHAKKELSDFTGIVNNLEERLKELLTPNSIKFIREDQ